MGAVRPSSFSTQEANGSLLPTDDQTMHQNEGRLGSGTVSVPERVRFIRPGLPSVYVRPLFALTFRLGRY